MADDSDESVLFENSPLHDFLKSIGHEDDAVEALQKRSPDAIDSMNQTEREDKAWIQFGGICMKSFHLVLSLLPFKSNYINKLNIYHQQKIYQKLVTSNVLLEMDADFLCELDKTDFLPCKSVSNISWINAGLSSVLLPCLLAYLVARCMQNEAVHSISHPVLDILTLVTTVVAITSLAKDARICMWQKYWDGLAQSYEHFVLTSEQLSIVVKKSLQLVQERELIARGFSLVPPGCAASQLVQKVSSTSLRQCPELRKQIFLSVRACMLTCRKATLHIITTISLEDYGPCVQMSSSEDIQTLSQLTDGFSVSALKAMNQLFSLHLSQFVRRLAQCFSLASTDKDPFVTLNSVQKLCDSLLLEKQKLQQSLDFHQCGYPPRIDRNKTSRNTMFSKVEHFHSSVHNLELRLQSALMRVQQLSSQLESVMKDDNTKSVTESVDDDMLLQNKWLPLMIYVKSELQACQECWEDGMNKIKKPKPVPKLDHISKNRDQDVPAVLFSETDEYVIEDQVFEAYSDPGETLSTGWDWDLDFSDKQKEKRKKEKEDALRLMTELRCVISVRAEEMKRREQIALAKVQGVSHICDLEMNSRSKKADATQQDGSDSLSLMDTILQLGEVQRNLRIEYTEHTAAETDICNTHDSMRTCSDLSFEKEMGVQLGSNQQDSKSTASEGTEQSDGSSIEVISNWSSDDAPNRERDNLGVTFEESLIDLQLQGEFGGACEDVCDTLNVSDSSESEESFSKRPTHFEIHPDLSKTGSVEIFESVTKFQCEDECGGEEVSCLSGSSIAFTARVAAMVAIQSQSLNLNIETFGDSDSDDCDCNRKKHDEDHDANTEGIAELFTSSETKYI
ncbi:vezatin-like isoform X2 [Gigantopelta aegis]|uniref:vezatin-like isoform X2 n=1 Tax=Gigantopelta aegis TaxID=1735272 RepID=UPI001B889200|nr:vezatin-like isoform X2 [Gigantopelta aegis]